MKKLIALISVLMMSSMIFADADYDFYGSARLMFAVDITQAPEANGEKPDPEIYMCWDDAHWGPKFGASVSKGDLSAKFEVGMKPDISAGDIWGKYQFTDAFHVIIGRFGTQCNFGVGGSVYWGKKPKKCGAWDYGGGQQLELGFKSDPSSFHVNIKNMKKNSSEGKIHTVSGDDGSLVFGDVAGSNEAFLPTIDLTYAFANDVFNIKLGAGLNSHKFIQSKADGTDSLTNQITSFGVGTKLGFTAGIFGLTVSGGYVVNPSVMGGIGPGFSDLAFKEGTDELVNNNWIGFATDIDFKFADNATAEVGFGYGFNMMPDIEFFKNDAALAAYLQGNFNIIETFWITPEVGFTTDMQDYNGNNENMSYYFVLASKMDF